MCPFGAGSAVDRSPRPSGLGATGVAVTIDSIPSTKGRREANWRECGTAGAAAPEPAPTALSTGRAYDGSSRVPEFARGGRLPT